MICNHSSSTWHCNVN